MRIRMLAAAALATSALGSPAHAEDSEDGSSPLLRPGAAIQLPTTGIQAGPAAKTGREEQEEPDLVTDRPDFTESAETVPACSVQVESGVTFSKVEDERSVSIGEVLIRAALTEKLEARFSLPTYSIVRGGGTRESGFEDLSVGLKAKLRKSESESFNICDPDIALILDAGQPTGSSAFREPHIQPGAKLCLAWALTKRLGLSTNLNYRYASDGGEQFHQGSASVSLGYELTEKIGLYAESFGFTEEDANGSEVLYVNSGITYELKKNHQIDARIGTALNGPAPNVFFGVGYSFRF